MYVVNPEKTDVTRLYKCQKLISDWLIYTEHISPFGRSQDGQFYFAKTEKLKEALERLPLHLRVVEFFQ
jgi:hypothetical protein